MSEAEKNQSVLDSFEIGDAVVLNHDNEHDHKFTIKAKTMTAEGEPMLTIVRYGYRSESTQRWMSGLLTEVEDARLFTKLHNTAKSQHTALENGTNFIESGTSALVSLSSSVEEGSAATDDKNP